MRRCETHFMECGYCYHPEVVTIAGGKDSTAREPRVRVPETSDIGVRAEVNEEGKK